jgi:hypothetical protein
MLLSSLKVAQLSLLLLLLLLLDRFVCSPNSNLDWV